MTSYLRAACLIWLALLAAAATPARADDVAAIRTLFEKHSAALSAGDAAALTALFTDNPVMMPPERPAMTGKEAIRWGFRLAFGLFTAKVTGGSLEIEVAGDWAYARRVSMMTLTAKTGGEQVEIVANWLEILKRQPDGAWRIHLAMVNTDRPLPGVER